MAGRHEDCPSWRPVRFSSCNPGCSRSTGPDAPWPRDVESLRRRETPDPPDGPQVEEAASGGNTELARSRPDAASTQQGSDSPDGTPESSAEAESSEAHRVQPQSAAVPARFRVKLPFWLLGLLGTAAFLGLGVAVLAATLAPKKAALAPDRTQVESALRRIAASVGGDVTVERLPTGRLKLSGHLANRAQRMSLTQEARAVDPAVLIHVSADDDLEKLAREAVALFPGSGAEFGGVHRGRLTLKGHVSEGLLRDRIVAAMWDEVPGLVAIDDQITAADDGLTALHELLSGAGLAERIAGELDHSGGTRLIVSGSPDDAERLRWAGVRGQLVSHFGDSLPIVERFTVRDLFSPPPSLPLPVPHPRARPSSSDDVVAVVMGPMPYVLLRDGTKQAGSLATGTGAK